MALKLQEEYGDDLQVLFVEVQGTKSDAMTAFAAKKKWLGGEAMWTTERPFSLDLRGIPQFGLLSPEGELVLSGHTNSMKSQIEDTIHDLVRAASKPRNDLPKSLGKALIEARDGNYAKALKVVEKTLSDPRAADEHPAAEEVRGEIATLVERAVSRVTWLLANGYAVEAEELLDDLADGVDGTELVAGEVAELAQAFETDAGKAELAASKELNKLLKRLYKDGPDSKLQAKIKKLALKHEGTSVAARALTIATYAG